MQLARALVSRQIDVPLSMLCNNACRFCSQAELRAQASEVNAEHELAAVARELFEPGEVTVVLTGGEPTLDRTLTNRITRLRESGAHRVVLQTNGRMLAYPELTRRLVKAGITRFEVALHGATPAEHDWHTGVAGSFAQTQNGIRNVRDTGTQLTISTVLTRANFRSALPIVDVGLSLGMTGWRAQPVRPQGERAASLLALTPRLELLRLPLGQALARLAARRVPARLKGLPLCTVDAQPLPLPASLHMGAPHRDGANESSAAAYGEVCDTCALRPKCPGVNSHYLRRWGASELQATPTPAPPQPATEIPCPP